MNQQNFKDQPYQSFGGYGVDVAVKRTDDLDKKMLTHLLTKDKPKVLDLGSGAGGQSVRMAEAGASVLAIDVYDFSEEFAKYRHEKNLTEDSLKFICANMTELQNLVSEQRFSDATIQRTLHYLPYNQALELLTFLRTIVEDKLFVSVTGMDSAVGENYAGRDLPLEKRFLKLSPAEADIFQIHNPVCLYRQEEFVALLNQSGWQVEEIWQSAFGNLKAVCA